MLNQELLFELRKRFEIDQKTIKLEKKDFDLELYNKISLENTDWLKKQIEIYGWLSSDIVGEQGELFAWTIVQHSEDINFQKYCLDLIKKFPITEERKGHIIYLTDRILIKENKNQIYGTQFLDKIPDSID